MKKRLMLVMGLAVAALGIGATAAVLGTTPAVFTRATGETRSIVLTAADFTVGSGNFNKSGMEFHYEGVKLNGNTVTLDGGRVYMTMAHYSGDSVNEGGLKGNGFTALAITDLNLVGDGYIVYAKPSTTDGVTGTYSVAANIDLTHQNGGAEVSSDNRVRIHVEAGPGKISFTKLTYSYECVEAQPTIEISGDQYVEKNATGNLTATTERVDGSATYNWTSSNTGVATIVGNGKSATVTGVAAGGTTITVQAIVNEAVVATDTFDVTVTDPASKVYMDWDKTNKEANHGPLYFQGTGIILGLDLTSVGRNEAWVNSADNKDKISFEFSKNGVTIVNWQKPAFSDVPGFYVYFGDAAFSNLTSITIRMPNDHDVLTVAEMTLSWSDNSHYTIETINGKTFAAYMGIAA